MRRNAGLCVVCGVPANKSRCTKCMADQTYASIKSRKNRIANMKSRIRELELELGGCV